MGEGETSVSPTFMDKHYFFRSTHYPSGDYNEFHPCHIVRKKWVEQGWYVNSFYRVSRFRGIKLPFISFGMISGYRPHRVPYIAFHWGNAFHMPTFIVNRKILWIRCEYGSRDQWTSQRKLLLARMKREKQKFTRQ